MAPEAERVAARCRRGRTVEQLGGPRLEGVEAAGEGAAPSRTRSAPEWACAMPSVRAGVAFASDRAPVATWSAPVDRRVRSLDADWIVASALST